MNISISKVLIIWASAEHGQEFTLKATEQPLKVTGKQFLYGVHLHYMTSLPYQLQSGLIIRVGTAASTKRDNKGHSTTFKGCRGNIPSLYDDITTSISKGSDH